ncbi:hypothetical protein K438DRAFT_1954934 [Mycena galopus ATCC 62051]|nr:hypothetical protein K438DRAFT_1954934 [Mycena galopus ATCC 62051]
MAHIRAYHIPSPRSLSSTCVPRTPLFLTLTSNGIPQIRWPFRPIFIQALKIFRPITQWQHTSLTPSLLNVAAQPVATHIHMQPHYLGLNVLHSVVPAPLDSTASGVRRDHTPQMIMISNSSFNTLKFTALFPIFPGAPVPAVSAVPTLVRSQYSSSSASSSREQSQSPVTPPKSREPSVVIKLEPISPEPLRFSLAPAVQAPESDADAESAVMLARMAEEDPDFAAALKKLQDRQLDEAKMYCALENKDECPMCSG